MDAKFKEGDLVTWTSQSSGYLKVKTGTVEEVVQVGSQPNRERFEQLYRGAGVGIAREHVSFVVRVPGKTAKSAGKLYWPRAAALEKSDDLGRRILADIKAVAEMQLKPGNHTIPFVVYDEL